LLSGTDDTGLPTPEGEIAHALSESKLKLSDVRQIIKNGFLYSFDKQVTEPWIEE